METGKRLLACHKQTWVAVGHASLGLQLHTQEGCPEISSARGAPQQLTAFKKY